MTVLSRQQATSIPAYSCHAALQRSIPFCDLETKVSGRTIVGVRCTGSKPWKVFLPVFVAVMDKVLIARRSMPRVYPLQPEDVELNTRDVSGLVGGYLSRTNDIIGRRMKRAVARGAVIIPSLLQSEVLIKRGQSVTLTVLSASLNNKMSGKALADGALRQGRGRPGPFDGTGRGAGTLAGYLMIVGF